MKAVKEFVNGFSPHDPHSSVSFGEWLERMALANVPVAARALAMHVAAFETISHGELSRVSGLDQGGVADKTYVKWKRYLIERGWAVEIESVYRKAKALRPALDGKIVRFTDLLPIEVDHRDGINDPSRSWLRQAAIGAFGYQCSHCGLLGTDELGPDGRPWALDRIIPGKVGGEYVAENVTLSCWACNSKRGASPIEQRTFALADWRALRSQWVDLGASISAVCDVQ